MILRSIAEMLIQEHEYRPISGRVLALGPQQVPMTREEVDYLFTASDRSRRQGPFTRQLNAQVECAPDQYFFHKFPIESLDSLDVVPDFGATVVHDLNFPIPDSLANQFDFIVDGGTFDHLLNIGIALENVVRMLRPGGRVFQYNAASNYLGTAYTEFGTDLFFDYYVMNGFADCKVYIARETRNEVNAPWDMFYLPNGRSKHLNSARRQMVIVIAEKGQTDSTPRMPVEHSYRSPELMAAFQRSQRAIAKSKRPVWNGEVPVWNDVCERLSSLRMEAVTIRTRMRTGTFSLETYRAKRARNRFVKKGYRYVGQI